MSQVQTQAAGEVPAAPSCRAPGGAVATAGLASQQSPGSSGGGSSLVGAGTGLAAAHTSAATEAWAVQDSFNIPPSSSTQQPHSQGLGAFQHAFPASLPPAAPLAMPKVQTAPLAIPSSLPRAADSGSLGSSPFPPAGSSGGRFTPHTTSPNASGSFTAAGGSLNLFQQPGKVCSS